MKFKTFFVLIALCFCLLSCGDEGILLNDLAPSAPPAESLGVGPVPEDIQNIIWGTDVDTLKAELNAALDAGDDIRADTLIHKICLRRAQEAYHRKYISAGGVAIMGNRHIHDIHYYAARDIVLGMTQKRSELRELLTPSRERRPGATQHPAFLHDVTGQTTPSPKFRMILSHSSVGNTAIPEIHAGNNTFSFHFVSVGGLLPSFGWVPTTGYGPERGGVGSIFVALFVHEFAHAIHLSIRLLDPTFDDRLEAAYAAAKENGSYFSDGDHALKNQHEYWAESAQRWFTVFSREGQEFLHNLFRETDPLMYDLLAEWFDLIYLREVESRVY